MHLHTVHGAADSSLTPEQLIEEARRIGLTGVNISEHDRLWDPHQMEEFRQRSGLFVSTGMEVSTDMGHMIVIGLDRYGPGIRRATELWLVADGVGGFLIVAYLPARRPVAFRPDPWGGGRADGCLLPGGRDRAANGSCTSWENEVALRVARILMRGSQGRSRIEMLSRSEKGE